MRRLQLAWMVAFVALVVSAPAAAASTASVFAGKTISHQAIPCIAQSDGVRVCHGADGGVGGTDLRLASFDGTPLEVYVILPPAPASGTDGPYPLVVQSHGWGGHAGGPNDSQFFGPTADAWARNGYAVLQLTARGFADSCGTPASRLVAPAACASGYIRLDDARYEARDVQNAVGLLVDASVVDPTRIGVTGESYGGGVSLELATLKDRVMNADGSLSPWTSPTGTPLRIAAAAPVIPWSDLAYSLMPNGRTLDYQPTGPTADLSPIGVDKQSFVGGLFAAGSATGFYAPPGINPQADLTSWFGVINGGEPYDANPQAQSIIDTIARYHSAYYLLDGAYGAAAEQPPPLLIANGFTDDLFPVDEALRYYNLEQSLYPSDPISLIDGDFGHMRAQNKSADRALLSSSIQALFDHYLKGGGAQPQPGVTAFTETCPSGAPSGGPYSASSWSALHPGEVDYSATAQQTIVSSAGSAAIARTIDPVAGGGACATAPAADQGAGVATYRLPAATGSGYTLLGSPTVIASLSVTGTFPEIAARLWDVDPSTGLETLVARGVYRVTGSGEQVFQLHPGGWRFAAGHVPKLELLGQDAPYARASNGTFSIAVSQLQLRLPVHEQPGSVPGVGSPLPPFTGPTPTPAVCSFVASHKPIRHHRLRLRGGACGAKHVYVVIFKHVRGGRCRFVGHHGHLGRARSCNRPVRIPTRMKTNFRFSLRLHVPRGRYRIELVGFTPAHRIGWEATFRVRVH